MVIDTSALMAILLREAEERPFLSAIKAAPARLLCAATRVELGMVALGRRGPEGLQAAQDLLGDLRIDIVPLTDVHAGLALDAFHRFGKGRHRAGLNLGDCMSYALAKATGEPLLFKGDDFAQTDIRVAV